GNNHALYVDRNYCHARGHCRDLGKSWTIYGRYHLAGHTCCPILDSGKMEQSSFVLLCRRDHAQYWRRSICHGDLGCLSSFTRFYRGYPIGIQLCHWHICWVVNCYIDAIGFSELDTAYEILKRNKKLHETAYLLRRTSTLGSIRPEHAS